MLENTYDEYLSFANILADASGEILRHYFGTPFTVEQKADQSPVTKVDIEVEQRIRSLIGEKFPEHGVIGEEFHNIDSDCPYQWVIDPIDGTRSFIAGYPIFTTLIALLHEKRPVLGIINQPILGERWSGIKGKPTLLNNKPLPPLKGAPALAKAGIASTSTGYFSTEQEKKFAKLKAACQSGVLGGDAYAYAMLASGRLDIVVDAGMKPYDFCALAPVIEGVGGIITDWTGSPISLTSDGSVIAASNTKLHGEAIRILHAE